MRSRKKMTDIIHKVAGKATEHALDFLRAGLIPHSTPGYLGYRYITHFIDDRSRFHRVRFNKSKDKAINHIKELWKFLYTQTGRRIKIIIGIDGGPEFGQGTKELSRKTGSLNYLSMGHKARYHVHRLQTVLGQQRALWQALGHHEAPIPLPACNNIAGHYLWRQKCTWKTCAFVHSQTHLSPTI
ncbi:hypothetical protein B0H67DRAFT_97647 [Lasiosphaeris hirsuta]|uniref:Integrase catalytic domain-containing protein n=1 Tax=Lasiosphaeris hirsuta TaxID=260670 RepID=A0AA40DFL9_9PEZI|nr:hypothetical protein B0H67DRAFT_97647 [Lasiosphaeris hirsuta]